MARIKTSLCLTRESLPPDNGLERDVGHELDEGRE